MKRISFILSIAASVVLLHSDIHAQQWRELGSGNNALNANGSIQTLATDKNGFIYAGGAFRSFVGNPNDIFYVAKWNGTTWSQLGIGTAALNANNVINTIATDTSGNVYAAGQFNNVGLNHLNYYVAKWDGSAWHELGSGNTVLAANGNILSVVTDHSGNVYAAGEFTDESHTYHYVAKWNGSAWSDLGSLNANSTIYTLAADALGNIYAAGSFTDDNGKIYVAKWDGNSWQHLGDPVNSNLNGNSFISTIALDISGNVYVTGNITDINDKYYVAKLNGNTWDPLGSGSTALNANGVIMGLAIGAANNVNAAGNFFNSSGKAYVAQWNGSNWSEVGTGTGALNANSLINAVVLDRALNVYAGGGFDNAQSHFYVAKYGDSTIHETTPTAINNVSAENGPVIIPNPATSVLSVTNLNGGYKQLSILDFSGITILTQKVSHDNEVVNISSLKPGIYLLQLTGEKGKAVFKLIKE